MYSLTFTLYPFVQYINNQTKHKKSWWATVQSGTYVLNSISSQQTRTIIISSIWRVYFSTKHQPDDLTFLFAVGERILVAKNK